MSPRAQNILRLVSTAGALIIVALVLITAEPRAIWRALQEADYGTLGAVTLLNLPFAFLFTGRSFLVLRRMGYSMPLHILTSASVLGNVAGALTPAASGEVLRLAALQRSGGVPLEDAFALVAYERLVSFYVLALSSLACIALTTLSVGPALLICGLCTAGIALPWVAARLILPRLPRASAVTRQGAIAAGIRYGLTIMERVQWILLDLRLLIGWSFLTLAIFAVSAVQLDLLVRSVSASVSFPEAWIAIAGTAIGAIASLLPLGLGVGDGSLAAILTNFDVDIERSAAVAVLLRATGTLPLLVMALVSYVYLSRTTGVAQTRPATVGD